MIVIHAIAELGFFIKKEPKKPFVMRKALVKL